jgi:hypothetical protein
MKWDKQETNWIIDVALFGGFLLALWLDLTGVAAHQWLGLAGGGAGRLSSVGAQTVTKGGDRATLATHEQAVTPVLRRRRRSGGWPSGHPDDRPHHLDVA